MLCCWDDQCSEWFYGSYADVYFHMSHGLTSVDACILLASMRGKYPEVIERHDVRVAKLGFVKDMIWFVCREV